MHGYSMRMVAGGWKYAALTEGIEDRTVWSLLRWAIVDTSDRKNEAGVANFHVSDSPAYPRPFYKPHVEEIIGRERISDDTEGIVDPNIGYNLLRIIEAALRTVNVAVVLPTVDNLLPDSGACLNRDTETDIACESGHAITP